MTTETPNPNPNPNPRPNDRTRTLVNAFLAHADRYGVDVSEMQLSVGPNRISINVWQSDFDDSAPWLSADKAKHRKEQRLSLKRAFSPFIAKGAPPHVHLEGYAEIGEYDGHTLSVRVMWLGAYACEKVGERTVTHVPNGPLIRTLERQLSNARSTEITEPIYRCKPIGVPTDDDGFADDDEPARNE